MLGAKSQFIKQLENMSFDDKEKLKRNLLLRKLQSPEELRAWIYLFFDILFPQGTVYPTSTHGPIDAMWRIYELIETGQNEEIPQICMLSSRDSYKCQAKGSKLLTKNGLMNIENAKIGDTIWSGWNWKKITDWIDDGHKDGLKLTLKNGIELKSTPIHRYWILRDGLEQWCEAQNLKDSDLICVNINTPLKNGFKINQEEFDDGYFLGLLYGDGGLGSICSKHYKHISFTNIDKNINDWFNKYCEKYNIKTIRSKHDPITTCIWNDNRIEFLKKKFGLKPVRSWEKELPDFCYNSNSAMIGFVSGLFDSDGTFDSKGAIDFPITARKLLKDLQTVMLSWGIHAHFRENNKKYQNQKHKVYHLIINSNDIHKLYEIGFQNNTKKASSYAPALIHNTHDTLPIKDIKFFVDFCNKNTPRIPERKFKKPKISYGRTKSSNSYTGITYGKLFELLVWFEENIQYGRAGDGWERVYSKIKNLIYNKWIPVKKTEKLDNCHFYDLTVEDDHSYWSNGCISHNTLGAAAIEVVCMLHFRVPLAHMAAIKQQSAKAVQYVGGFFRKLRPYLEYHGWKKTSDSKTYIEWITEKQETIYFNIVTATIAGANSEHVPILCVDEVDVIQDPRALKEAQMIPSVYKGFYPLTVYLSTRKYAGGLMEKTLKRTQESGGEILRWNILDITERITHEEAKVNEPKVVRYVSRSLPMENLTEEEFNLLPEEVHHKYEKVELYAGIADHPLASVMRNMLVDRPQDDLGDLYKPVSAVRNNFRQIESDMAEAQLLCNKPSASGLVYPRFDEFQNVISIEDAFKMISGEDHTTVSSFSYLQDYIVNLGIPVIGGGDWGFSDYTALGIFAILPNGAVLHLDTMALPELELSDIVKYATEFQKDWNVKKWFVDQNYPAYLKTLRKKGLVIPKFKKVVEDGITAIQGRIVNSENIRKYFILDTPNNKQVKEAFGEYRWKLDGKGEIIEGVPYHDKDGVADIMDMIRYPFQNLFSRNSKVLIASSAPKKEPKDKSLQEQTQDTNRKLMQERVGNLSKDSNANNKIKKKGSIFWGTIK